MTKRLICYAWRIGHTLAVVDPQGVLLTRGDLQTVLAESMGKPWEVQTAQDDLLAEVLAATVDAGIRPQIALSRKNGAPRLLVVDTPDGLCWQDGTGILPDGVQPAAVHLGLCDPAREPDGESAALRWCALHQTAKLQLHTILNVTPGRTIASTALRAVLPRRWRNAAAILCQQPDYPIVREAYYGGRVESYAPQGWQGPAVEYDLRAAYGWAATVKLPDPHTYLRPRRGLRFYGNQPAWVDATVRVASGSLPGPLPMRIPQKKRRVGLCWPHEGQWRAWFTRQDVEQPNVEVIEIHAIRHGRWSLDLARPVAGWIEQRERSRDPYERALLRACYVGLSGKLGQRPQAWELWVPEVPGDPLPEGAIPLADFDGPPIFALPSAPKHPPITVPHAASYVTARVRAKVYRELLRGDALYTDTDSIHLPAGSPPPRDSGTLPGQWGVKAQGQAVYRGVRDYCIGPKRVAPAGRLAIGVQHHGNSEFQPVARLPAVPLG